MWYIYHFLNKLGKRMNVSTFIECSCHTYLLLVNTVKQNVASAVNGYSYLFLTRFSRRYIRAERKRSSRFDWVWSTLRAHHALHAHASRRHICIYLFIMRIERERERERSRKEKKMKKGSERKSENVCKRARYIQIYIYTYIYAHESDSPASNARYSIPRTYN